MIKSIFSAISNGVKFLWNLTGTIPYLRLILLGILGLVIIIALISYSCGPSELQQQADQTDVNAISHEVEANNFANEANVKQQEANKAQENSNKAVQEAANARNANTKNTNLSEAERNRCKAYPEAPGCGK